jgi:hypothetical protein
MRLAGKGIVFTGATGIAVEARHAVGEWTNGPGRDASVGPTD